MIPQAITSESILRAVTYLVAMLLSLSFHEAAHAFVASLFGDKTAKLQGRLTLNPIAHIDPIGTIVLPLVGALANLPVIGWAKPVPVDLRNLRSPRLGNLCVSLAGPISNLILATLCIIALAANGATGLLAPGSVAYPFVDLAKAMIWVNAFLAFFNLLPIPPLDGAAMATSLMPSRLAAKFEELVAPYGYFILMMIIISGGLRWLPGVADRFVQMVVTALGAIVAT